MECSKGANVIHLIKDFRPSGKFDNPYSTIPKVTIDNSEHLWAHVSGTCFRVLGTLLLTAWT